MVKAHQWNTTLHSAALTAVEMFQVTLLKSLLQSLELHSMGKLNISLMVYPLEYACFASLYHSPPDAKRFPSAA